MDSISRQNLWPDGSALIEVRASAVLPNAGAWDIPGVFFVSEVDFISLAFTYTRGGAGGAFDYQIEYSLYSVAANVPAGAQEWINQSVYALGAVAAGVDTQSRVQREYETCQATGPAVESFVFGPIALRGTIERMRIMVRESGNVQAPGIAQIQAGCA